MPRSCRRSTTGSHFSGDLFLAFSATNVGALDSPIDTESQPYAVRVIEFLPWGAMDPLYAAVVGCVEEAVLNALVAASTMVGRDGHRSPGFPVERLEELLART
jgi:D-aminopeptidase